MFNWQMSEEPLGGGFKIYISFIIAKYTSQVVKVATKGV